MSELERKNGPSAVAETVTKDGRRIGTEILFSAKDITKTFGGTQALKGVELEIHPGEIVGLVGENGAGKSTTIKCILNLIRRDGGEIQVLGLDNLADERAVKAQVGVVLDETTFHDGLSAPQSGEHSRPPLPRPGMEP